MKFNIDLDSYSILITSSSDISGKKTTELFFTESEENMHSFLLLLFSM
jgi:hypothetical protein